MEHIFMNQLDGCNNNWLAMNTHKTLITIGIRTIIKLLEGGFYLFTMCITKYQIVLNHSIYINSINEWKVILTMNEWAWSLTDRPLFGLYGMLFWASNVLDKIVLSWEHCCSHTRNFEETKFTREVILVNIINATF